jgi:hypothetical protein
MRTLAKVNVLLVSGVMWAGLALQLRAADPIGGNWGVCIYSNSINDLQVRFNPGTLEVGDQIILAGNDRYLNYFDFEYWGAVAGNPNATAFTGSVEARVRFYKNEGTPFNGYATPNDMFYDSGWFGGLVPTDYAPFRATIYFTAGTDFPNNGLLIPADEITWSVQFQGMGTSDTVGVDLYSPPVIGQNYDDYWQNGGSGWTLLTNSVPMDFGARMYATPEPSSFVLSLVGGFGILTLARRLRRKN